MQILHDDDIVVLNKSVINSGDNAFVLLAHFKVNAVEQGVNKADIESVLSSAMSGDYEHLVSVLKANSFLI